MTIIFSFLFCAAAIHVASSGLAVIDDAIFDKLQEKVATMEAHLAELDAIDVQHSGLIESLKEEIASYETTTASWKEIIVTLLVEVTTAKTQISAMDVVIKNLQKKVTTSETLLSSLQNSVRVLQETAITDIRLWSPEEAVIWKGPGFTDADGYVITSVQNFNSDTLTDTVARRRLDKNVNGTWSSVGQ